MQKSTVTKAVIEATSEVVVRGLAAYPELETPNETGQYQTLIVLDPSDPKSGADKIKALVAANLANLYPNGVPKAGYWNPIRSGDEVKGDGTLAFKDEAFRGKLVVRLKTKYAPKVFKGEHRDPAEASIVRSGDHVFASLNAYSYKNASTGVGMSLSSIWWIKPGERAIGAAGKSGSSFANVDVADVDFSEF
jgi:hypothetical protein